MRGNFERYHINKWYVENDDETAFYKMLHNSKSGDTIYIYRPQTLSEKQLCDLIENKITKNVNFAECGTSDDFLLYLQLTCI